MDLRQTFVLANEFKEGDLLVGGADDAIVRDEARRSIEGFFNHPLSLWERARVREKALSRVATSTSEGTTARDRGARIVGSET